MKRIRSKTSHSALLCVTLAIATSAQLASAQTGTPPTGTQALFYVLDAKGNQTPLEYKIGEKRLLTGFAIQGERSTLRYPADANFKFLARLPIGMAPGNLAFVRYNAKDGWRQVAGGTNVPLTEQDVGNNSFVFSGKEPLRTGEYCFSVNTKTNTEAFCLGIDPAAGVSEAPKSQPDAPVAKPMTNADVIKMASAGLPAEVISSSIRQATGHSFDLSVDGLIALKTKKIPDAVIATMQQFAAGSAPASAAAPNTRPTSTTVMPPEPPDTSVFYYVNTAGKLGQLEVIKADLTDNYKTLTDGVKAEFKIFGARSPVRMKDGDVSIVIKMPQRPKGFAGLIDEGNFDLRGMLFRRWEPTPGARQQLITASKVRLREKRDPDPGEFDLTVSKLGDNFFRISPVEPLIPGEYCIAVSFVSKYFCFGIDAPR
jgi:hypothetical protein